MIFLFQNQPIPKDIPLPLPMPEWFLIPVLVISFLAHILFVNLMLGGSLLVMILQIMGLKESRYDKLAKEIATTVTVNKSLAVVLGVAPLLGINTLYTLHFYSANALTGSAFISVIPLVAIAFLILYYHKYNWEKYENRKTTHITILGAAIAIFLFIPLVFLSNVNLMLFPEKWGEVQGFFSTLLLWNVIPRYLHFIAGTLAVTGIFTVWYFGRKSYSLDENLADFQKNEIRKKGYQLTFYVTLSQIIFGPLLFFTLPWHGVDWPLAYFIIAGISFAVIAMYFIYMEIKSDNPGKHLGKVILLLTVTVLFMGWGRHTYRENVLSPHKELMKQKTEQHLEKIEKMKGVDGE